MLETSVEVQTVTSTLLSVVEITPTPTWKTLTKTVEKTTVAPTSSFRPEIKTKFNVLEGFGGVQANVIEIPRMLRHLDYGKLTQALIEPTETLIMPSIVDAEKLLLSRDKRSPRNFQCKKVKITVTEICPTLDK